MYMFIYNTPTSIDNEMGESHVIQTGIKLTLYLMSN